MVEGEGMHEGNGEGDSEGDSDHDSDVVRGSIGVARVRVWAMV